MPVRSAGCGHIYASINDKTIFRKDEIMNNEKVLAHSEERQGNSVSVHREKEDEK